jgi:hypothetical protein
MKKLGTQEVEILKKTVICEVEEEMERKKGSRLEEGKENNGTTIQ